MTQLSDLYSSVPFSTAGLKVSIQDRPQAAQAARQENLLKFRLGSDFEPEPETETEKVIKTARRIEQTAELNIMYEQEGPEPRSHSLQPPATQAAAATENANHSGDRSFALMVFSEDLALLPDNKQCSCSAATVPQLCAAIRSQLQLSSNVVVQVFDNDFEEWIRLEMLDDLPAEAKVAISRVAVVQPVDDTDSGSEGYESVDEN